MTPRDEITAAGTVECSECGHEIERHDRDGCQAIDDCSCRASWTVREIQQVRRLHGLVGEWRR